MKAGDRVLYVWGGAELLGTLLRGELDGCVSVLGDDGVTYAVKQEHVTVGSIEDEGRTIFADGRVLLEGSTVIPPGDGLE